MRKDKNGQEKARINKKRQELTRKDKNEQENTRMNKKREE